MTTLNKNILSKIGFAMVIAVASHSASAHETSSCLGRKVRWHGNHCHFRVDTGSMSTAFRTAFQSALSAWNATPANFIFTMNSTNLWFPFTGNLRNEVWMSNDDDILNGALAVCVSWTACAVRMESDIIFDNRVLWTSGRTKSLMRAYGGPARPFQAAAIHEVGHALGLKHESDTYNVMGDATTHLQTNGSIARSYVGEDATDGGVFLYGLAPNDRQDLGVSHWRRSGAFSGYSTHRRTRIFVNGIEAPKFTSAGGVEPVYLVRRGQVVQLEMSYENNGSTTQYPDVDFHVSVNDFISSFDPRVGSRTITVNRNRVYTRRFPVTIPTNLNLSQTYFLGAKIDPDNQIAEFDESNNATYVGIRIVP